MTYGEWVALMIGIGLGGAAMLIGMLVGLNRHDRF